MRRDERLLGQVQRLVGVAKARPREPEYRLAVAVHDLGEGGLPARDAERRQLAVGERR